MRMRTDGHKQVKWLETGLKEMNHGKGLGFVVYGTVVDTWMLGFQRHYHRVGLAAAVRNKAAASVWSRPRCEALRRGLRWCLPGKV